MNKNQKKVFLVSLILILILIGVFCFLNKSKVEPQIESKTLSQSVLQKENLSNPTLNKEENTNNTEVTLNVLDKTYKINIKSEGTVYDAMNSIKNVKENNFSFIAKEYPGLGIFIDEISGVRGTPDKYWIYYVNSKEASIGVSNYVLKSGDIINWKQE